MHSSLHVSAFTLVSLNASHTLCCYWIDTNEGKQVIKSIYNLITNVEDIAKRPCAREEFFKSLALLNWGRDVIEHVTNYIGFGIESLVSHKKYV